MKESARKTQHKMEEDDICGVDSDILMNKVMSKC